MFVHGSLDRALYSDIKIFSAMVRWGEIGQARD